MKILVAEDTEDSRIMLELALTGEGYAVMSGSNGAEALEIAQATPPDLIISDILMPEMDGFELCRQIKANPKLRDIPFIFYTATYTDHQDEELALALGADRFLIKPIEPSTLMSIIRDELLKSHKTDSEISRDSHLDAVEIEDMHLHSVSRKLDKKINELEKEREALKKSEEKYRYLVESIQDYYFFYTRNYDDYYVYVSPSIKNVLGYKPEEFLTHRSAYLTNNQKNEEADHHALLAISGKEQAPYEMEIYHKDGSVRWLEVKESPTLNQQGAVQYIEGIAHDITERKQAEEMLQRSQKMEALGKLTGGIAHDFNNMLGVVLGYAEILEESLNQQPKLAQYAHAIYHAAQRGKKLTKKLLAFSRHKVSDDTVLNINTLLQDQRHMLEKILTVRIKLIYDLADDLWTVEIDTGDLEDSIVNLSINAMHAMQNGGELTIRTSNEHLNAVDAKRLNLTPGDYILLSVTDTGHGMDSATKAKIFDPFYTTKEEYGTGLGLSQVYGFIERCNGAIEVFSELQSGTRFDLYFPRNFQLATKEKIPNINSTPKYQGNETLLVVDDEKSLADLAKEILSSQGYKVLIATTGEQAIAILENETIDLIISDVLMPDMDGFQLSTVIRQRFPDTKIQLVSGYTDDWQMNRNNKEEDKALHKDILHKPYSSETLLTQIRKQLDKNNLLVNLNILVVDDDKDILDLYTINLSKLGCNTIIASNSNEAILLYQQYLKTDHPIDVVIIDLNISNGPNGKEIADTFRTLDANVKIIVGSGHSNAQEMIHYRDYGFDGVIEKNFDRKAIKQILEQVLS